MVLARDGQSGLAAIDCHRPDLAILNLGLPDIHGFELARLVRRALPDWPGRVLALSGYGMEADKQRAADAGFDRHLTKPVNFLQLQEAMEEVAAAEGAGNFGT